MASPISETSSESELPLQRDKHTMLLEYDVLCQRNRLSLPMALSRALNQESFDWLCVPKINPKTGTYDRL